MDQDVDQTIICHIVAVKIVVQSNADIGYGTTGSIAIEGSPFKALERQFCDFKGRRRRASRQAGKMRQSLPCNSPAAAAHLRVPQLLCRGCRKLLE